MRAHALASIALVAACGHSEPFTSGASESGLLPGHGGRMTYNIRDDRLVGHSATGEEVFYTYCEDSKAELHTPCGEPPVGGGQVNTRGDRCLGALPASGGGRILSLCGTADADADSIKQFLAGTRLADGTLVYVYLTRRWTASFSVNPALFVLRPGATAAVRVHQFPARPLDSGVPHRLIAAGPDAVLALGGDGPQLITVGKDAAVTIRDLPGAIAADAATGRVGRWIGEQLALEELATGIVQPVNVPATGWALTATLSVSMAKDVVAITQREVDPATMAPTGLYRVLVLREGREPALLALDRDVTWGAVSLAPDARSLVIERNDDLYRFELP